MIHCMFCVLCALALLASANVFASQISVGVIVPGGEDYGKQGTSSDQASKGAREGCVANQFNSCTLNLDHPPKESEDDYADLVTKIASQNDFILDIGYNAQKATHKAADDHPEKNFAIIDFEFTPPVSNIASVMFRDDQEGYLAGLLSGELASGGVKKVVVISGLNQPDQLRKANGFANGVNVACPDCTTYCHYSKSFTDEGNESDQIVKSVLAIGGVDVVYSTASTTGTKALKRLAAESGIKVIGSGTDEWETNWGIGSVPGSEHVITSTIRDYENVVRQVIQSVLNSTFTVGRTVKYGITGDPQTTSIKFAECHEGCEQFSPELKSKMHDYMVKIASGELDTGIDWKKGDNKSGQGKCKPLMKEATAGTAVHPEKLRANRNDATRFGLSGCTVAYVGVVVSLALSRWAAREGVWML